MSFFQRFIERMFLNPVNSDAFAPEVMFKIPNTALTRMLHIANAPVKSSVTTTWVIIIALTIFSWLATRNLKEQPKTASLQNVAETFVESMRGLVGTTMGPEMKKFTPYIGTLMIYLTIANLVGIIPGKDLFHLYTPTADLNTTAALGAITFVNIHFFGIKSKGITSYFKGYFEPLPFMFPLNVIGSLADPVSLSFRLFGNMIGSVVIMGLLYSVMAVIIPGIASIYFDVFAGVLQAFIFTMLTMTYISMEME
ncbi:F0F1 ATP synthase subunit A [Acetohalobium arabaticum]|uniref:ATP synthase subunit a n=1 Tax=Acetohalobium arabaticum (strain ATCC 49924 / DSM 5501 / Z-7288) TaxID=574087 RepID=D9QTY8_ACEAZ|nr:F0F1 ATP synthase subunit A [Acetohalobium arabaticum]ADL13709.1 ATP synthase F0, A subunit [Acetohalobium arabaticum DSM 5501]